MYKRVLFLGDSQTERGTGSGGWVSTLGHKYCRYIDITNRGLSGYNTKWTSENFNKIVPNYTGYYFDMAVVWFGSNDAVKRGQTQHVSPTDYERNLTMIVCNLINMGILSQNILVLTPPTVDEAMLEASYPGSRRNQDMEKYAHIARDVARSRNCKTGDLFDMFQEGQKGKSLFTDGLHLSDAGNTIVAEVVDRFIEERVGTVPPCPDWKTFN